MAWSWAVLGKASFIPLVHASCQLAERRRPVSTWNNSELLDTAHAFTWSSWTTGRPALAWSLFSAWASQGMLMDAASVGLLMMDAAYCKNMQREAGLCSMLEQCSAFKELTDIFAWCASGVGQPAPEFAMRFDTRTCPGSQRHRGSHAKLALLVADLRRSGASDAASVLEAIRQHSYGEGQWLKVAGGGKANLIETALRSQSGKPSEVALEFGVFVGYTTIRMAQRALDGRIALKAPTSAAPFVVGLEVEPVHTCVARWILDLAGLSGAAEVWAGMAHDLLLRAGDEFGQRSLRLCFMDHRGTRFHDDLDRLEQKELLAPGALVIADNVLKPSAPLFCWITNKSTSYKAVNWALGEFVQYHVEDWMVVAEYVQPGSCSLPPPPVLLRLAWDSDKWRRKSEEDSVSTSEWAAFSRQAREVFRQCGLEAQPWLN